MKKSKILGGKPKIYKKTYYGIEKLAEVWAVS
jgi:hypothetical protein